MSNIKKTVLITGGAKRLGARIAQELAGLGYDLILHYNQTEPGVEELKSQFPEVQIDTVQCDFSDIEAVAGFVSRLKEFKKIDVIINNASIFPKTTLQDSGFQEYEANIQINALAPFVMTKDLCAHFNVECVINMIDSRITGYEPDRHPYHASKRLFFDLTKDLALALSPRTRVNAVCPGAVLAPEGATQEAFLQSADLNPLKTTGHPDQIAQTVTFLLQNSFVTGQTIFVDGGRHLYENFYGV